MMVKIGDLTTLIMQMQSKSLYACSPVKVSFSKSVSLASSFPNVKRSLHTFKRFLPITCIWERIDKG